jgi:hypothetical protein
VLCSRRADSCASRSPRAGAPLRSRRFPKLRADALARELDVDLDAGVCHACLGFVSFALDDGDPSEISRWIRRMTPDLWGDGLAEPALAAVRRACDIVRRLAEELSRRARTELRLAALRRERLPPAAPELN